MSAIRPLATIGLLMVLGYFLWTRINTPGLEQLEEPKIAMSDATALSADAISSADSAAPGASSSGAPAFQATAPTKPDADDSEFSFSPTAEGASDSADTITPFDAAAMPDLPPLPSNIPTANYSASPNAETVPLVPAPSNTAPNVTPMIAGQVPELGTSVGEATDFSSSEVPLPPADALAAGTPPPLPPVTPEPVTPEVAMGAGKEFAAPRSAFASARTTIDAALERGDLKQAHLLLSSWYGDRSLTPEETEEVDTLLGQLAGTVIYSPEHLLEAPHRVAPGETLESIAQSYQVPWQLLAKINGIADPKALTLGQELKVLRGPFSAVIDVERQEMALMVANRYAGRFTVKTEGQATSEGEWYVTQKMLPGVAGSSSKQVVLSSGSTAGSLVLGTASANGPPGSAGAVRVAPQDQDDLFDILSIGSKVIIRR